MPHFPHTPRDFRHRIREPFSHERILNLCYAYKRLYGRVKELQGDINNILSQFEHSNHGKPSQPLTAMIAALSSLEAQVHVDLVDDVMQVELETIRWEQRSSKLKSEAKRQARLRAERAAEAGALSTGQEMDYHHIPGTDPFGEEGDAGGDATTTAPTPVISPTYAKALKGMSQLPSATDRPAAAPDTSTYKASGLV